MKIYRKENRKLIIRYEDALDKIEELKEKMVKIEEVVTKKDNELYSSLKKYFNIILSDFNITNKNEKNIMCFMNLIQFFDDGIIFIISFKFKKNLQFNFFK